MYFWNIKALAEQLRKNLLSQRQKAMYYMAVSILGVLATTIPLLIFGAWDSPSGLLGTLCCVPVIAVGVPKMLRVNGGDDGRDFLERLIVLSFPVTVRTLIAYWSFYLIVLLGGMISRMIPEGSFDAIAFLMKPAYLLAWFWQMSIGFQAIINAETEA